jgi:hypothetical protein
MTVAGPVEMARPSRTRWKNEKPRGSNLLLFDLFPQNYLPETYESTNPRRLRP